MQISLSKIKPQDILPFERQDTVMKKVLRLAIVLAFMVALISSFGCGKLRAKDRLNEGTRSYNKGNYAQAERLFKEAIESNPELTAAKLYYAASLRAQYSAGGDSIENKTLGEKAIKAYQDVIASSKTPKDIDAAHAFIAELYKGLDQKEEHRNWILKRVNLQGQTDDIRSQAYYTLAVGYWEDSYKITQRYVIPRSQPPAYKAPRDWEAGDAEKSKDNVLKGLGYIEDALKINPKYANCYSYRALLYREQLRTETDPKAREDLEERIRRDTDDFQRLNRETAVSTGQAG